MHYRTILYDFWNFTTISGILEDFRCSYMLTKVTPTAIVTPGVTVLPLFKFIADQLSDLAFYDCPEAAVVVGDFAKGLRAAIAAKARNQAQI